MTTTITVTPDAIPVEVTSMGYDGWWCPCGSGLTPSDFVVVYQPKGASSYINSLINLNSPGTNNAYDDGIHAPGWNATDGWVGDTGKYLYSNISLPESQLYSMMVRFSACGNDIYICGVRNLIAGTRIYSIQHLSNTNILYYNSSSNGLTGSNATEGIFGWSGSKAYRNGVQEGEIFLRVAEWQCTVRVRLDSTTMVHISDIR